MNAKSISMCLVLALAAAGATVPARANQIAAGIRWHAEHKSFTALPYSNGDLSYVLGYEFHEPASYLQFALAYMPSPGGSTLDPDDSATVEPDLDYVLTPQINILWKDNHWRGGVGALTSMISDEEDSEWTRVYWQIMLGINLAVGPGEGLDVLAHYVFQRWRDLPSFRGSEIDFGATIGFRF